MKKLIDRLKFKQKLLLSYLIVIIIPILVLGIFSYVQSKQLLKRQAMQSIEKNIGTASDSIAYKIDHFHNQVNMIIGNRTIQGILSSRNEEQTNLSSLANQLKDFLDPYFSMLLTLNPRIAKLTIYTESKIPEYGDYIRSSAGVLNQIWYREAVGKFGLHWYVNQSTNKSPNELVVVNKFPETFLSGRHILYMRVEAGQIFEDAANLLQDYAVMIESPEGEILYSNVSEVNGLLPSELVGRQEGVSVLGGIEMMVYKREIDNTKWTLYCFVPVRQVSGDATPILYATVIIISICIVILLIIISIFASGMLRRIYELNVWMKRVEKGELEIDVHSSSRDEIGELTIRFGNMLIRIKELLQEVRGKELIALQAQMNPHFLYNTLSSINWKALKMKSYEISHIVTAMSKYYRTALNNGENYTSIHNELENVKSYLDIMLITNDHSFDVFYSIDEEVYRYDVINMILQPLAENAIKHGLNQKTDGRGQLFVSASVGTGTIEITITDNGPGMEVDVLNEVRKMESMGYGLKNVNERIKLHFGTAYGITVNSEVGQGTTMQIVIPKFCEQ